jgi:hypothetical protein
VLGWHHCVAESQFGRCGVPKPHPYLWGSLPKSPLRLVNGTGHGSLTPDQCRSSA